jgi:CheY-like chemotaxis protein
MRILIVDDETEVQRIREHLEPRGFEVRGTRSGDDALRLWGSEGPWNLVLTELWITPGRNIRSGLELAKEIRSASPSQRIAIHTSEKGLAAASVTVLRKPCRIEQLLQMLRLPVQPLGVSTRQEKSWRATPGVQHLDRTGFLPSI